MRVLLESTTLASVLYDPLQRRLDIEFRSGQWYRYFQAPPFCYQQLLEADSKGAYFNRHIRNRFPFQHLSDPPTPVVLPAPPKN
jgi:hypothetical protein